jgi:hypothetical protein
MPEQPISVAVIGAGMAGRSRAAAYRMVNIGRPRRSSGHSVRAPSEARSFTMIWPEPIGTITAAHRQRLMFPI